MMDHKHHWLMMLACVVPLLLIVVLRYFGVTKGVTWIAMGAMVVAHLVLMRPHHDTPTPPGVGKKQGRKDHGCH